MEHRYYGLIIIVSLACLWLIYSLIVFFYLRVLTRRYLTPINRDEMIIGKSLKTHDSLENLYKDKESLNILILSGGGLRGLVPLRVLEYLEEATGKKTGELFDFISGSSTGAISAAALVVADAKGEYKYSAKEIFSTYEEKSRRIFSSPWYHQFLTFFGLFAPRFLPDNKLAVLDEYFGDMTIGELKGNLLIPVYDMEQDRLQIIKNWSRLTGEANDNFLVKDLINGASNPPMLFPPIAFHQNWKNNLFIDPAVLLNNPILHVLLYVRGVFPDKQLNLVMVGNGSTSASSMSRDYKTMFSFGIYGLYQYLFNAPSLSNRLYIEFLEEYLIDAQRDGQNVTFFRINAEADEKLSPTNISKENMRRIHNFADKMVRQNLHKLNKLASVIAK